jgi:hypothetical protein
MYKVYLAFVVLVGIPSNESTQQLKYIFPVIRSRRDSSTGTVNSRDDYISSNQEFI